MSSPVSLIPCPIPQQEAFKIADAWNREASNLCKERENTLKRGFSTEDLESVFMEDPVWTRFNECLERLDDFRRDEYSHPRNIYVKLCSSDNTPQSLMLLLPKDDDVLEICLLVSAPKNLGETPAIRGAGTAAMVFAAHEAIERYGMLAHLQTHSSGAAEGFYARLGFEKDPEHSDMCLPWHKMRALVDRHFSCSV